MKMPAKSAIASLDDIELIYLKSSITRSSFFYCQIFIRKLLKIKIPYYYLSISQTHNFIKNILL
jgi:hypothetical protein